MNNINTRVMDYVVLVQDGKLAIEQVPKDINFDVTEILAYLKNGKEDTKDVHVD